mgnify:CR=1 FL=1
MEPASRPETLAARIRAIRLPKGFLAEKAALDPMTISRVLSGKTDPLQSTLDKIERVVAAEEIALRDLLLNLHPLGASHDTRTAS